MTNFHDAWWYDEAARVLFEQARQPIYGDQAQAVSPGDAGRDE
jgi:hypothetical protein